MSHGETPPDCLNCDAPLHGKYWLAALTSVLVMMLGILVTL